MKRILICLLLLCSFFGGLARDENINKGVVVLSIGDRVPEVVMNGVVNSRLKSLRLSAFRGKVLILDFWATNCGSCINALPRLESLQQRFGDSIAIITVSYEQAAVVRAFLRRNAIGRSMRLPIVTADVKLAAMFPHQMLSHEVWIDGTGVVRAITEAEYVNAANISALLHGRPFHLPLKSDVAGFDYQAPLLSRASAPAFYSMVSRFKPGVAPRFGVLMDSLAHTRRLYMVNFPLLSMYMLATDNLLYFPKTLLDIRVKDSARVVVPAGAYREEWKPRNYWCYETVLPARISGAQLKTAMLADLNKFFGLNGRMEKRRTACLSLERLSADSAAFATAGGVPLNTLHRKDGVRVLTNAGLSNIIWELNDLPGSLPAVDNTRFTGKADLRLAISSFRDLQVLNLALRPYGLVVRTREQELSFFVLTDND
jgi:thiol-disulfide isomerase/thioredoxin